MNVGTLAYGLASGMGVGVGFLFLGITAHRKRPQLLELAIAMLGFSGALATSMTLHLQSAESLAEYGARLRGPFALSGLVTIIAVVWVTAGATRIGVPRVAPALTVAGVAVAVANQLAPGGLIVQEVIGLREVTLFGEELVVHEANRSTWRFLLDGYLLAVAVYLVVALVLHRRRHGHTNTALLGGLIVASLASLYDSLVDEALVNTAYLGPFGMVAFALGLAFQYGARLVEVELRLSARSSSLENLVTARTRSLKVANERVLTELARQEETTRRITQLARGFVALGTVTTVDARDGRLEPVLRQVIGGIGEAVSAAEVSLQCFDTEEEGLLPPNLNWHDSTRGTSDGSEAVREEQRRLQSGDLTIGQLTIRRRGLDDFTAVQRRLIDLSTEFVAATIRRLQLEGTVMLTVVDEERQRIARELHDSVSQRLYAAAFNADVLVDIEADHDALAVEQAGAIRSLVLSSVAEMRTLLFELQPQTLEATSLVGLLEHLCTSMGEIYNLPIRCEAHAGPSVEPQPKLALYRIAQEALGNALRHSGATNVDVLVDVRDDVVTLDVTDDGVGFEPGRVMGGQGLSNVAERAAQIGATLEITSTPGFGTTLSTRWTRTGKAGATQTGAGSTRTDVVVQL